MLWLSTQIWVWLIVAVLLGVLCTWLCWSRPLGRRIAELEAVREQASPPRTA
ncbi:MAG: hypothetical protein L0H64_10540 [Pseudonocardia sp.]|nr:hypothetical protein [Pseudonocardia sp.]